jgi:hypothetical protein
MLRSNAEVAPPKGWISPIVSFPVGLDENKLGFRHFDPTLLRPPNGDQRRVFSQRRQSENNIWSGRYPGPTSRSGNDLGAIIWPSSFLFTSV